MEERGGEERREERTGEEGWVVVVSFQCVLPVGALSACLLGKMRGGRSTLAPCVGCGAAHTVAAAGGGAGGSDHGRGGSVCVARPSATGIHLGTGAVRPWALGSVAIAQAHRHCRRAKHVTPHAAQSGRCRRRSTPCLQG